MPFPTDLIPIEPTHGMSVVTAIVLLCIVAVTYYTIRWIHNRTSKLEDASSSHNTDIATMRQTEQSITKSLDLLRKSMETSNNRLQKSLDDAEDRIEDRFRQIQTSLDRLKK